MAKSFTNLRIPGPTPLPSEVISALSQKMINHRGPGYEEMQQRIINNLKYFFGTKNDIYLLTSSGMGGLEAAIVNFFSPGDRLVFFTCGEFGNRWAEIARRFGGEVIQIKREVGKNVEGAQVGKVLETYGNVKGLFITHNETSTGVVNDLEAIVTFITKNENKPLLLVDGISSIGAIDLSVDKLGIDVAVSASQKAWMAPPGIAMISVSEKAWEINSYSDLPRYYFDLRMYREYNQKNQTPATPAVTTLFGLDESLKLMLKEGKEEIYKRHISLRDYLRKEIKKIGLELFVGDNFASPTVTSIKLPVGIDDHEWVKVLREKYNTIVAGGMGETKGKIIRIAHMGYVSKNDLDQVIEAIKRSLKDLKIS